MYAARDVTSTVSSPPHSVLFSTLCRSAVSASSLLPLSVRRRPKESGELLFPPGVNSQLCCSSLVLDIKWGVGCYQASLAQAQEMAVALQQTSASLGLATTAVISHMQSPLGRAVGNSLEVGEALDCLHGRGAWDLRELVGSLLHYRTGYCTEHSW